ncbi:MAG: head GIN domain-containing protein [Flavitalea sp.]
MRKFGLALALLFSVATLSAQKQISDANAEKRSVSGYHGINVSSGVELFLTQGESEAVAVSSAGGEFNQDIKTEVKNGILHIGFDHMKFKNLKTNKKLKAYVSIKNIDLLDAASGAHVKVDGKLKSSKIDVEASSGAMIDGEFDVESMEVDQSSGSIIKMRGNVADLKVEGSSGSMFEGYDLTTNNTSAECSSGAIVRVTANKELNVRASSGGSVNYKGTAVIRNIKTGSGGSVSRKG